MFVETMFHCKWAPPPKNKVRPGDCFKRNRLGTDE